MKPQLFAEVREKIGKEFIDFAGTKTSVIETSHRSTEYSKVHDAANKAIREYLKVPEGFGLCWVHGEKEHQYEAIALNFGSKDKGGDYLVTGPESMEAFELAKKHTPAKIVYDFREKFGQSGVKTCPKTGKGQCPVGTADPNVVLDDPSLLKSASGSYLFYVDGDQKSGATFQGLPKSDLTSLASAHR